MGYIHRDLKPDNIVLNLEPLAVRIIDFDAAALET
jgi:serine/threonine protein kinase